MQGSAGLLTQIENLLQLPTINKLQASSGHEEEQAKAVRRQLMQIGK